MSETDRHNGALVRKDGALAGAAVSAAVGLAAYGLRKVLAEGGDGLLPRQRDARDERQRVGGGRDWPVSVLHSGFDSLLPLAEDAAAAAGKWVAENSPPVVRDRLLPRFIDSFKAAA
jgi:hypothetical protein